MASQQSTSHSPNPPEWMQPSESSLADGARKHVKELLKKRSSRFSFVATKSKESKEPGQAQSVPPPPDTEPIVIQFRDERNHILEGNDDSVDQFRWAILYENQRGITIFSTAYYSSRSLLPHDPPPFTVPDSRESSPFQHPHHAPPNVTLTTYPLPDPTWRWVSKSWLVDMRGDGDVQHDGFEYNWFFQRCHWRARVGWLSAGGYVRRRRWVRLMIRPSEVRLQAEAAVEGGGREDVSTKPKTDVVQPEDIRVWRGDDGDWDRIRKALKSQTRDGPKLDLWMDWLVDLIGEDASGEHHGKGKDKDRSIANEPEPQTIAVFPRIPKSQERPPREWIVAVLRKHGKDLRSFFVYPDSRAELRDLLMKAKVVQESTLGGRNPGLHLPVGTDPYDSSNQLPLLGPSDFWSRNSGSSLASTEVHQNKPDD